MKRNSDNSNAKNTVASNPPDGQGAGSGVSRRSFLTQGATAAVAAPLVARTIGTEEAAAQTGFDPNQPIPMVLRVNGQSHSLNLDARTSLLDALREYLSLTGTKKGCDHGQCGACTVHVNGVRALSCLTFAISVQGQEVTTIEGLARGGRLHPMQAAFIDQDAFQCGYCTPGQIMSAIACIREGHATTPDEIREYMSGNLCRCAAYPNIVAAIMQARQVMEA